MAQELLLEIIKDVSFHERVKTKKGVIKRFRYRKESSFFKLRKKTLKDIQREIDLILKKQYCSIIDWKIYTRFPFE